jgi:hypothetical protein
MNFEFDNNSASKIKNIFDDVFCFFSNRSKWKNLYRARDEIIKLNSNIKIELSEKDQDSMKSCEVSVNDTIEWKVKTMTLTKLVYFTKPYKDHE